MPTLDMIRHAVRQAAAEYPVKRVELFGSYANGTADADSDVDFLVEFSENPTSLLHICGFRETLSELLQLEVDIVKLPRKPNDGLQIDRTVCMYEGRKEKGVMSMSDFQKHLAEQMENPDFAAEYDTLEAQYSFARQMIAARIAAGMTQAELAAKVGTSQANICKLEHAELNPSFALAQRVANGLGKRLTLSLR